MYKIIDPNTNKIITTTNNPITAFTAKWILGYTVIKEVKR